MVAASFIEPYRSDPTIAEAMELRWSLKTATDMQIEDAIFESDSQIVINAIHSKCSRPDIDPIIADCIHIMRSFNSLMLRHVNRRAN